LGGELDFDIGDYGLGLRSGVAYETSAIPDEYLSAATVDLDKTVVSVGGSLYIGKWRFDSVFARVFASSVTVNARDAKVRQVNPVLANPAENPHTINGGTYTASANVIGLGLAYQFDSEWHPRDSGAPATTAAPPPTKAEPAQPEPTKSEPSDEDEAFEKAFEEEIESQ
jgi:long-chain fatty acid transport protein